MTKTKSRFLSLLVVFSLLVSIVGAVNVDFSYAAARKIHLRRTTVTIATGKKYQQKLINKSGKTIAATKVKWKSLKKSVAKIDKRGKITAVKAGTARMTAKYKGKTYKFTVKVKKTNKVVSVDRPNVAMLNDSTTSVVVHTDKGKSVSYKIDNQDVVSCEWGDKISGTNDKYLKIKSLKKGSAVITVYDTYRTSVKATVTVSVVDHNTVVSVDQETMDLDAGKTVSLIVMTDLGKDLSYTLSNKNVSCSWGKWIDGTTNRYLYVTGEKEGSSTITITDRKNANAATAVTVNVKDPHVINAPSTAACTEYDSNVNPVGNINITTITVNKEYDKLFDDYIVTIKISGTRTPVSDDVTLTKGAKILVLLQQNGGKTYTEDIPVLGNSFTNALCKIHNVEPGEYEVVINKGTEIKIR